MADPRTPRDRAARPAPPAPAAARAREALWRYGVAAGAVAAATLLMFALYGLLGIQRGHVPFIFYFGAVIVAARYGGRAPGLFAVTLSALVASYFFVPPFNSLRLSGEGLLQTTVFVLVGSAIVTLAETGRRAVRTARVSEQSLETTLRSIGDAVIATDAAGRVTFMNPVAERLTGWAGGEARGRGLAEVFRIVNEETRAEVESPAAKVLREGAVVGLANHTVLISKTGAETPIDDSGAPIRDASGEITGVVLVFHDITDRRRAEGALARLAAIVESSDDAIIGKTLDGRITNWNTAAERLYGYTAEEALGQHISFIVPPELKDELEDILRRLREGQSVEHLETVRVCKDGRRINVSLTVSLIRDAEGETVGASTIARDITERKRAEQAIRVSEQRVERERRRLRELVGNVPGVVWEAWGVPDEAGQRIDFVSDYVETMLGYTVEEWLRTPNFWLRLVHEEDRERAAAEAHAIFESGTGGASEFRWLAKDGRVVPVEAQSVVIRDEDGRPAGMRGVTLDITARKEAEAALLKYEARYRLLFESNPQPMWVYDLDTLAFLAVNEAAVRSYGYTREEFLSLTIREIRPPEDVPRLLETVGQVTDGLDEVTSWRHLKRDGTLIDVEVTSHALVFAGRRAELVLTHDITERKRAEDELRASESRYRALADAMPQIVWTARADGYIDYFNERWFDYTGLTLEQTKGWGWQPVIHPEDLERTVRRWAVSVETGREYRIEYRFRRAADGEYRWHLGRAEPMRDSSGRVVKWFGICMDIHDQKQTEERVRFLAEANALLASSLDYETTLARLARLSVVTLADHCIIDVIGDDGRARRVATAHRDPAKESLVEELRRYPPTPGRAGGIPSALASGRPVIEPELTDERLSALARGPAHLEALRRLGPTSFMAVPLNARDRTLGAITLGLDTPGRRYAQTDLTFAEELARRAALAIDNARLYSRAQEANRSKDEFLATLSHELRTPLTPVIGWTHMIRSGQLDEPGVAYGMGVIDKNAQALLRLISDLLDMTSILTGKMRIERAPVELEGVLREAVETVRPQADAGGVALELSPVADGDGGAAPALVSGDRTRLVQVFWNLLTNAVKFSRSGARVRVALRADAGAARVDVSDEGLGIEPEFLPRVFERFSQADGSTTRAHGGLGIGLALVRSFVEAHGGTAEAFSEGRGRGSRFTVTLPLSGADGDATKGNVVEMRRDVTAKADEASPSSSSSEDDSATPSGVPSASPSSNVSPPPVRVLVVEDARDTLEMLRVVFGMRGYEAIGCATSEEALRVADSARFDIIVSDIGLPRIDGYELIKRLRGLPHLRTTPALALTGYAAAKDAEAALAAGFDAHLPKPVEPSALAEEIERLLERAAGAEDR